MSDADRAGLAVVVEPLDLAMVHDQGGTLALGAQVLPAPAIEAHGVRLRSLVDGAHAVLQLHRHQGLRVALVCGPRGIPRPGVDRAAVGPAHVGEDVEVVDRAFDQEGILHLVAEGSPVAVLAHVAGEAQDQVVDGAAVAGPEGLPQGRLVLGEAVAHGDPHLPPRPPHLLGDAARRRQRVRDRFLREDVHAVGQGRVDDLLVKGRRHDDGSEVGVVLGEGPLKVGVALLGRQAEMGPRRGQRLGVGIDGGGHLDQAVLDVGREDALAPGAAPPAGADLDHSVWHGVPDPRMRARGAVTSAVPSRRRTGRTARRGR